MTSRRAVTTRSTDDVIAYAPRVHPHRRWFRRAVLAIGAVVLIGMGSLWGPRIKDNLVLLNLQNRCLRAGTSADKVVYQDGEALALQWRKADSQYVADTTNDCAVWFFDPWNRLYALLSPPGGQPMATIFIGERHVSGGRPRLVVIEGAGSRNGDAINMRATVIEPGSLLRPARILATTFTIISVKREATILAGQADPIDPALVLFHCESLQSRCDVRVKLQENEKSVRFDARYAKLKIPAPSSPVTLPTSGRSPASQASAPASR